MALDCLNLVIGTVGMAVHVRCRVIDELESDYKY